MAAFTPYTLCFAFSCHLDSLDMQVMELDPVIGDLARCHFGFVEDERMKVSANFSLLVYRFNTSNIPC